MAVRVCEQLKSLRWTSHALNALVDRSIDQEDVERAIKAPEFSELDPPDRIVLMRKDFDQLLAREMLLRVVVEETPAERVIVTVYKTSQFAKYLKGARR